MSPRSPKSTQPVFQSIRRKNRLMQFLPQSTGGGGASIFMPVLLISHISLDRKQIFQIERIERM